MLAAVWGKVLGFYPSDPRRHKRLVRAELRQPVVICAVSTLKGGPSDQASETAHWTSGPVARLVRVTKCGRLRSHVDHPAHVELVLVLNL